jgi:heme oxygenase
MPVEAGYEVVDRIRRQTSHWPRKIEACSLHRMIAEGKATREGYVKLLQKMHAFLSSYEGHARERREWRGYGFEMEGRWKLERIERDLAFLGQRTARAPALDLPLADSSFSFLCGYLYVIESATMAGQNQFRILSRKLGINETEGGEYLSFYGAQAPILWRECQDLLERVGQSRHGAAAEMIAGATDAYQRLEKWLRD